MNLAKPTGISLEQHSKGVEEEAKYSAESHPFIIEKYRKFTDKDFAKRVSISGKYHDKGKEHPNWQNACKKDYEAFKAGEKYYGKNLQKVGLRHEICSLVMLVKKELSMPVRVAIAAHHKKLSNQYESRWSDSEILGAEKLWEEFKRLANNAVGFNKDAFEKLLKIHYEYAGVRAYTQLADHRTSIKENIKEEERFVPEFKSFEYHFPSDWVKRPVQQLAEKYADEPFLLLRAPTGSGKTEAALLWAKKQIESKRADRLVIAMPTRFTSNALAQNIEGKVSETGLYHSSAWFNKHESKASESKLNRNKEVLIHEFARMLESPVTVCTIDHLLASITLSREAHHGILFNLANSCLVIDESDFYDDFTLANIQVFLRALRILEVPVLTMSASLPDSSLVIYKGAGYENIQIREDTTDLERERCQLTSMQEYSSVADITKLLLACKEKPSIIFANTIDNATQIYNWFKKEEMEATLYHSRFTEGDKKKKEELLITKLGSKAWENGKANGVAILTQIGEISVNISADYMLSELCPIDRLVQRVGRLSRFNNKCGNLKILVPMKKDSLYPAPYGSYIPRVGWEANSYLTKTKELLKLKKYSANDFVELVNAVYDKNIEFSNRAKDNARNLESSFINNWIFLPSHEMNENEEEIPMLWKSRDIASNVTVFVKEPSRYFKNYMDYQIFKNENGIAIPDYLLKKAIEESLIYPKEIGVRDEVLTVYIVHEGHYTFEAGLVLSATIEDQFL